MNFSNHAASELDLDLPLLLAGPILRRVDKSKICIWISTSKNVQAKIMIYRIINSRNVKNSNGRDSRETIFPYQNGISLVPESNLQLIGEGINSPVQLGDNLFVNLVIALPFKPNDNDDQGSQSIVDLRKFPTNELLAYDLELISPPTETGTNETISLKDLGLLSGENSIVYGDHTREGYSSPNSYSNYKDGLYHYPALPMFYIPDTIEASSLNLLYGSCRKLYGDDEDSLIIGDKLIQAFTYDLEKRPSALFLIGDQIYADNVADPLIAFIKKLSSKLLGWKEGINGIEGKLVELNAGERKEIVSKYAKFSTDVGDNHLLGFGEFAAMYIIAWNQLVWPCKFDEPPTNDLSNSDTTKKYINETKELEQSRQSLFGIRRLLANIPTYMICDDHEITDDWNINKKWRDDVEQSVCGEQIISNGLLAFWAFQAWGNDPESYSDDFIQMIKQSLYVNRKSSESFSPINRTPSANTSGVSLNAKVGDTNLEMNQELKYNFIMSVNWTFVAPTYPLSVFLDCRTQRTFIDEEGPPHLLSDRALSSMKSMLTRSDYKNGDPILLVSPTPVFGFELAESVQRFLTSISGSYKWDLETWRASEIGFVKFLAYLASNFNPSYCIFLSGDVHYAFTMKAHFQRLRADQKIDRSRVMNANTKIKPSIPIVQFTSSPFRSNSLTNRMVAIWILNLVHKVIVIKKLFRKKKLVTESADDVQHMNYDYFRILPDIHDLKTGAETTNNYSKQKIHFSKHGNNKSLLAKIKVISFNLILRYFKTNKHVSNLVGTPWAEHRLLIKPKGRGALPVLARNNIGHIYLDLNSKSVRHTHYFLKKDDIKSSQTSVHFQ